MFQVGCGFWSSLLASHSPLRILGERRRAQNEQQDGKKDKPFRHSATSAQGSLGCVKVYRNRGRGRRQVKGPLK